MSHLDRDVAAFVDGQLAPEAAERAEQHLGTCASCRAAVAQQRLLKSRMKTGAVPGPPSALLASLSSVPVTAAAPETAWDRLRRSPALGVGVALVGASLIVVALAFAAGAHEERAADPVRPPFEELVRDFQVGHSSTQGTMTVQALDELDEQGWPCHPLLAGDLHRVDGRWHGDDGETVSLTYSDGSERLRLYERVGTLDDDALDGFALQHVGDHQVWVRGDDPTVVTWDSGGIVFVAVTDVDEPRLADVVAELPAPREPRGAAARMSDGLDRMTAWVSP